MKKNFIKVSVICALTLASSAAVVSCSDYDDDIKNHQEQIDALKKQLEASKTEITDGLNTAIEGLKAEIDNIAGSKADAASVAALEQKAAELQQALDSKAGNDQITSLTEELQGMIADVNSELTAAMEETKSSLQNEITSLQQKQDELNQKIEEITGDGGDTSGLQEQLNQISADLAKAQNDLKTILDANYGQQIAELQTKVTSLEGLKAEVEGYTDDQIATLDSKLTGEIATAIADVKTLIPEDLAGKLTNLENKFADYVTKNEIQDIVDFIGDLSVFESETLSEVLAGKASAADLTSVSDRVADLESKFDENGEIDQAIKAEVEALRKEISTLLGNMIQSIMYVPQFDNNFQAKNIEFNTLKVKKADGSFATVADNVTSKIQFRVTPASAAATFKDNYAIAFEGKLIGTRAAQTSYLQYEYVEDAEAEAKGIVTFNVSRSPEFTAKQVYALCAHITPIQSEESASENLTDISSDFFVAGHDEVQVDHITVKAPNFDNSVKTVAWNDLETKFAPGTVKLEGTYNNQLVNGDLAATFGADKFTVTYALTTGSDAFKIDANSGEVSIKNATSSAIDKTATAKATVTAAGVSYTTNYNTTFKVTKDIKHYAETVEVNWLTIATGNITVDLLDAAHKTKIADAFGISINDWTNIVNTAQITEDLGTSLNGVRLNTTGGNLSLTIDQLTHIAADKEVTITLKDNTASGTTQSSSEYEIKLTIKATKYVDDQLNLTKQAAVWDGEKVVLTPTFDANNGKITRMNLSVDVTSIYQNFDADVEKIDDNYAYVTIQAPINTVAGITAANYDSNRPGQNKIMTIDQSQYNGGATINARTQIIYDNSQIVEGKTQNFTFGVQQLAGTFVNNAPAKVQFGAKNDSKQLTGLTWKDYLNRAMWIDGKVQIYNAQSMPNAVFAVNPFSNAVYAMDNCVPAYSLEQANDYLEVDAATGVIKLTQSGKDKVFVNDYTAKLVVTINKPRWGEISGLGTAKNGQYKLTFDVVIPAGIQ